ncbi:hypothetical protein [Saccharopolyspora shandongensis]|uniref:hypothetical protein n=1 Tax=Saccharopolyspora shandongensis TaxID=418495 RepID=UPI0033CB0438
MSTLDGPGPFGMSGVLAIPVRPVRPVLVDVLLEMPCVSRPWSGGGGGFSGSTGGGNVGVLESTAV